MRLPHCDVRQHHQHHYCHGLWAKRVSSPARWMCMAQQPETQQKLAGRLKSKSGKTRTAAVEQVILWKRFNKDWLPETLELTPGSAFFTMCTPAFP